MLDYLKARLVPFVIVWCIAVSLTCLVFTHTTNFFKPKQHTPGVQTYRRLLAVPPSGEPRTNIMFLKTHKTATNTFQSILLRFTAERDLAVAFGREEMNKYQLGWPMPFQKYFACPSLSGKYNLFFLHARYSDVIPEVMADDTVYITAIREPVAAFESMMNYYKLYKHWKLTGPNYLETFSKNPRKWKRSKMRPFVTRNQIMFDLGLNAEDMDNESKIAEVFKKITRRFDFVILAEYFDESLMLLRNLLNWSFEDMVYLKKNVRQSSKKQNIPKEVFTILRQWNKADVMLYDYYNRTFWKMVEEYSIDKLQDDVKKFRRLREKWENSCVKKPVPSTSIHDQNFRPYGDAALGYKLRAKAINNRTCISLAKAEIVFTGEIYRRLVEKKIIANLSSFEDN